MKNLIMLIVTVFIIQACKVETPITYVNLAQYDKYNIDKDTNWVEITDTTRIYFNCLNSCLLPETNILLSDLEYKLLWDTTRVLYTNFLDSNPECKLFKPIDFNFEKYSIIGMLMRDGGHAKYINRLFLNKKTSEIIQIINHEQSDILNLICTPFFYKIPKLNEKKKVLFDTINGTIR